MHDYPTEPVTTIAVLRLLNIFKHTVLAHFKAAWKFKLRSDLFKGKRS